jgi:DNA-binding beta-propeller fold protein YncE
VPLVWPAAPEAPRITFVKTFSRPQDLGITKGFFRRLADIVFGAEESRLIRPMAVLAIDDVIYVADPGAKGVHRFDPSGAGYQLLRAASDAPLPSPVGLARGSGKEVFVTDSVLGRVFVIQPGAKIAVPLPLRAPLGQPTGIAFDAVNGHLYVVDTTSHQVKVFNREGDLLSRFGTRGTGDGEFNYPTLLWQSQQGQLYLTDSLNYRVQVFDRDGKFLTKFGKQGDGSGDAGRQKGVATDSYGHVYIVDALFNAMQVFDNNGQFLLSIGTLGRERGEFWLPAGVFIGADDSIYVVDSYNQRVQVFRYVGGPT